MQETKNNTEMLSWAIFLGCMFVGMGVGEIFDQAGIGMLIGMGVGYIAEAITERALNRNLPGKGIDPLP